MCRWSCWSNKLFTLLAVAIVVVFTANSFLSSSLQLSEIQQATTSNVYQEEAVSSHQKNLNSAPPTHLRPTSSKNNRATTFLIGGDDCIPSPNQNMTRLHSFPFYSNFSDFVTVTGSSESSSSLSVKYSICEFQDKDNAIHFAHAMQQLYGCWSFWQSKNNLTQTPVLFLAGKMERKMTKNAFLNGFLEALKSEIGLLVIPKRRFLDNVLGNETNTTHTYTESNLLTAQFSVKGGYALQDPHTLREKILALYDSLEQKNHTRICDHPRVAILNRRKPVGRSILNAMRLSEILTSALNETNKIPITYFEGASFSDQVQFFTKADIVISPHGAQLTGLPFLGTCGAILELFPTAYLLPNFYGSLSINSGILYSYLYLSKGDAHSEKAESLLDRIQARATNLCPAPAVIVEAVKALTNDWRECCSKLR
jgi:hypothetical protein